MNDIEMQRLHENEREEKIFKENLHSLLKGNRQLASRPLVIGKTPYSLAICGADGELPLTITKKVIDKCMRPEIRDATGKIIGPTGHGLTEALLRDALSNIKAPVMILRGAKNDSLVIVTDLVDDQIREMVITVELNKIGSVGNINSITSVYGRTNFNEYLERQIDNENIIAINKEKTDQMLLSIEKWYLKANTFISFDNSIAYTPKNVNYSNKKSEEPISRGTR